MSELMPITISILAIGLVWLIRIAWSVRSETWKIDTFFLGGRNIGAPMTGQVYWGTSFSLANGIFYFAVLGYFFGLSAIWFQIPWMASIWFLAWQLPRIMEETERHTIHGFLGSLYGDKARKMASIVTITGFLGAFAFEINISMEIILGAVGRESLAIPITILAAFYVAAYCDIGGFLGTAKTDGYQNKLGLIAVLIIGYAAVLQPADEVFADNLSSAQMISSLGDFSGYGIATIVGIIFFASTVNIVDMSNWQAIAANSKTDKGGIWDLRKRMVLSSFLILLAPAMLGTFLGYVWQGATISDSEILPRLIINALPASSLWMEVFLGIIILGLAAITLSTADSVLIASAQTYSWDYKFFDSISEAKKPDDIDDYLQYEIVKNARRALYIFAVIAVIFFLTMRHAIDDQTVFVLQFVIFGAVISLAPSVILGIYLRNKRVQPSEFGKKVMFTSIFFGYLSSLGVSFYVMSQASNDFNAFAWSPIITLSVSALVASLFLLPKSRIKTV